MKLNHHRSMRFAFAGGLCAASALAAAFVACSSGANVSNGGANPGGGSGNAQTACVSNDALRVLFSPAYSAYDGMHTFQVPAIVDGINGSLVTWSVSDPSKVSFQPDPSTGGIMMTTLGAGSVTITAQAGNLCGSSVLTITQATPDDWAIGNARYNNGVSLHLVNGRLPDPDQGDAGVSNASAACTSCHGQTAQSGFFKDIAHTPEQTAGFSDQEMIDIAINAQVPDGGYFDPAIISYHRWQEIHHWADIAPDQQKGMVVYLRSLTPTPQMGSADWGGHRHPDGGMGDASAPSTPPPSPATDGGLDGGVTAGRDAG